MVSSMCNWHSAVYLVKELNTAETKERNLGHPACRRWTQAAIHDHPCLLLSDSGHSAVLFPHHPPFSGSSPTGETKSMTCFLLGPVPCSTVNAKAYPIPPPTQVQMLRQKLRAEMGNPMGAIGRGGGPAGQASRTSQQRGILS